MSLADLCPCCGTMRPQGATLVEPCPWCGYDPTWNSRRRRQYKRDHRRKRGES